jgi:hypothetical protein
MKFPSLIKTNKFSSFHFEPRYYDPIKEEIDGKMKAALARESSGQGHAQYESNISAAFQKRQRSSSQTSVNQMLIAAAMLATFIGWVFYGNDVFYVYLLLSPIYFYFRLKGKKIDKD